MKLFEWDYVATLDDDSSTTSQPDLDDPDDPEIMFTISGQDDEPATAPTLQTAIELRGGVHHRSGSPNHKLCPSKGTQLYPRYQPGTRGTSSTPRQDSGTQNIAAAATGPWGHLRERTPSQPRPNPGQGNIPQGNTTGGRPTTGGRLDYLLQLAKGVPRPLLAARSSRSPASILKTGPGTISIDSTNRVSAVPRSEMARSDPED